jgi:hypothetical protein
MKDELRIYCMSEGINEIYLRARIEADKRLSRLEKRAKKKAPRSKKRKP